MNYLAHAYLSFNNHHWLIGNLISDYIKGKKKFDYPRAIQQGIHLHRCIDTFTDAHEATKTGREVFRPAYRLYSGAFMDVVYDHFLAIDKQHFSNDDSLANFAKGTYNILKTNMHEVPQDLHDMFFKMQQQNWLYNYQFNWGIEKSFKGVVFRSKYLTESETAYRLFNENYALLQDCYKAFFPDLMELSKQTTQKFT